MALVFATSQHYVVSKLNLCFVTSDESVFFLIFNDYQYCLTFKVYATDTSAWKALPDFKKTVHSLPTFRCQLKHFYFSQY